MIGGGDDAADALGLDRGRQVGVGLVDHERAGEGGVEAGHADDRGLVAELAEQAVGRALQRGAGDDRGHGDDVGRGGPSTASRTPGTASTGPIDTIGLDGAITTRSAAARASSTPGAGRAASAPSKRTADDRHGVVALHEVLLEADLASPRRRPASTHGPRARSSVTGSRRRLEAPRRGDLGGDLGQRGALGRRWVR